MFSNPSEHGDDNDVEESDDDYMEHDSHRHGGSKSRNASLKRKPTSRSQDERLMRW